MEFIPLCQLFISKLSKGTIKYLEKLRKKTVELIFGNADQLCEQFETTEHSTVTNVGAVERSFTFFVAH